MNQTEFRSATSEAGKLEHYVRSLKIGNKYEVARIKSLTKRLNKFVNELKMYRDGTDVEYSEVIYELNYSLKQLHEFADRFDDDLDRDLLESAMVYAKYVHFALKEQYEVFIQNHSNT